MAKKKEGIGSNTFYGTTYQEVVEGALTYQQLVENLYKFGLKRSLRLPRKASRELLNNKVVEFITLFMEATREALDQNPGKQELECAEDILKALRRPEKGARIHKKSGVRQRIHHAILKEIGQPWTAAPGLPEEPAAPETQGEDPGEGIPEDLGEIRARLARAWQEVRENTLKEVKKQFHVARRREAILDLLVSNTELETVTGVVSDHLEDVIDRVKPKDIIEKLRGMSAHNRPLAASRGRNKVTDKQLREDILLVRRALLKEAETLKETERELRQRYLVEYASDKFNKIFNAYTIRKVPGGLGGLALGGLARPKPAPPKAPEAPTDDSEEG